MAADRDARATGAGIMDLVVTRVLDAPVERVWRAWSDPEDVTRWWGPDGFTSPLARMDVRAGGTSLVAMSAPSFGEQYSTWRYLRVEAPRRMEYVHHLSDRDGNEIDPAELGMPPDFPQGQRHTVTFEALDGDRTRLTVTEHAWPVGELMGRSKLGLEQCLGTLAAMLR